MKIMYTIDSSPIDGGAPISTILLANEMAKKGNEVSIVMPKNNKKSGIDRNIKIIEINKFIDKFPFEFKEPIKALVLTKELYNIVLQENPDIIHANMPRCARIIGMLRRLNFIPNKIKLIYTDREHVSTLRNFYKFIYKSFIAKPFDHVVSLSKINSVYWQDIMGHKNVSIIPNTAGEVYELYKSEMHESMRKYLNINIGKKTVMFAGRFIYLKNWNLAKEIMCKAPKDKFQFIIAIPINNIKIKMEVYEFINSIKEIGVDLVFIENATQKQMSDLYYAADIFIMTSNSESFGRTAIEAMSRKCVVIGRNVGALPEVILKDSNIMNCESKEFIKKMEEYFNNEKSLLNDKEWFYNRYIDNYTLNINIQNHINLYSKLCNVSN